MNICGDVHGCDAQITEERGFRWRESLVVWRCMAILVSYYEFYEPMIVKLTAPD